MNFGKGRCGRILGIIGDVLFVVLLFCLAAAVVLFCLRPGGAAGPKFGIVQSDSMTADGLCVGDAVCIARDGAYEVGDIIAFYRALADYGSGAESADLQNCSVWVHKVIDVRTLEDGRRAYLTKGSSNRYHDGVYVPEDFVLGRAHALPHWMSEFIGFISSLKGIILLILVPCAIMLVLLVRELVLLLLEPKERIVFKRSFIARLIGAEEGVKLRYLALKEALLGFERCRARTSWRCETFRVGGKPFAKLDVRGRTLKLYLALPPEQAAERRFGIADCSQKRRYRDFPSGMRIRSDRAAGYAKELIGRTAAFCGYPAGPAQKAELPPEMSRREMLRAGYIRKARVIGSAFPTKKTERREG